MVIRNAYSEGWRSTLEVIMNESASETDDSSSGGFHAIIDAETIRTTVETVGAVVGECRLRLEAGGLHIAATDPATVASVTLDLGADAFETYDASGGRLGIDLDRLDEILSVADRDQLVEFALDADTRKLHIGIGSLDYTMALIDPDSIRSPPDPADLDFEYAAEAVVESDALARAVRAGGMVADHVAVGMNETDGTLSVEAEGDTDDVSLELDGDDLIDSAPTEARSLFSLEYLDDIDRAIPRDTELHLRLGTEIPLAIGYEFADETGTTEYVLAPRMSVA